MEEGHTEQPVHGYSERMGSLLQSLKLPPHSVEAEQAIIGGLLLDNKRWDDVVEKVSLIDFYRKEHKAIFKAIIRLAEEIKPIDALTVSEALSNAGLLEQAGGLAYLAELV